MFHVMTVIHDFRQIRVLNPGYLADLSDRLRVFAQTRGGREQKDQGGVFYYAFNSDREKALALISEFLFLVRDHLEQGADYLRGYTILLEKSSEEFPKVQRTLRNLYLLTDKTGCLWTSHRTARSLQNHIPLENRGDLVEILGPSQDRTDAQIDWIGAVKDSSWAKDLAGIFAPVGRPTVIYTAVPETLGFILHWFRGAFPKASNPLVLQMTAILGETLAPFVSSLGPDWLPRLAGVLQGESKKLLEDNPGWFRLVSPGILSYPGDSITQDLPRALALGANSLRNPQGDPGLVVLNRPSLWAVETRNLLLEFLNSLGQGIMVLVLESPQAELSWLNYPMKSLNWTGTPLVSSPPDNRESPLLLRILKDMAGSLPEQVCQRFFRQADPRDVKVLYLVSLADGLLDRFFVLDVLESMGEDPLVFSDRLDLLVGNGLLFDLGQLRLGNPAWAEYLVLSQEDRKKMLASLKTRLGPWWKKQGSPWADGFARVAASCGAWKESLEMLESLYESKNSRLEGLQADRNQSFWTKAPEPWKSQFLALQAAAHYRSFLNSNSRDPSQEEKFSAMDLSGAQESGEWLLQSGRHLLLQGDLTAGFTWIKNAYMVSQAHEGPGIKIRCALELGLALLKKGRVSEAWEYLEMGQRQGEAQGLLRYQFICGIYDAVTRMTWGSLSTAREILERIQPLALRGSIRIWEIFHWFLQGRVSFELGQYVRSEKEFSQGAELAESLGSDGARRVCLLWGARALAYEGRVKESIRILRPASGDERNFFLAEALYFSGDESSALELLAQVHETWEPQVSENPQWISGFAMVEDLCLGTPGETTVLAAMTRGFRAYLLGRSGKAEEGAAELLSIISNRRLSEINPAQPVFHFWWASLMPLGKEIREAHHSTILGKGLKDLQTRGSRITGRDERYSYLQSSVWNAAYMAEGKKFKLA